LKKERDRVEQQLTGLNAALAALAGVYRGGKPTRKRRKMSVKSRGEDCGGAEGTVGEGQEVGEVSGLSLNCR
jgi:hypothetical protein